MRGRISREWSSLARFLNINEMLDNRLRLSVEEYERLIDGKAIGKNCLGKSFFKFDGLQNDQRQYTQLSQNGLSAENL